MPPEDTRVRSSPVIAPPPPAPASRERALRLPEEAWKAQLAQRTLPNAAAPPVPVPADSALIGETIPALARLLDDALHDPPAPLRLRFDALPSAAARAPAAPPRLANALADAVSGSGVFFESHLADWVRGSRDTAPLLAEAHARAASLAAVPDAAGEAAFRQQISSLVTGELAFQFPAWPGQNAVLVIGREPEPALHGAPAEAVFAARLEMQLPELGSVQALLTLNGDAIDVDLRASTPATADTLAGGRDSLARAFAAADLRLRRIEVNHEHGA